MRISDFLNANAICVNLKSDSKEKVIEELVNILVNSGSVNKRNKNKVIEVLLAREALGSTAIGQGIAIPHGKCPYVSNIVACLGISKKGIDFDSLDGEPAHIFFLLLAPLDSAGPHLKALAKISRLLKEKYIRDYFISAEDEKTILKIIRQEEGRIFQV